MREIRLAIVEPSRNTLDELDWQLVLDALASHARTERGRRELLSLVPVDDRDVIVALFDVVAEAAALRDGSAGAPPVGGVEDIGGDVRRCARGEVLETSELRRIAGSVAALAELAAFAHDHRESAPTLAGRAHAIRIESALRKSLDAAFDARGELSEKTYPKLGELRARIAALRKHVRSTLDALLAGNELAGVLQDRYVTIRGDRFVVPIKAQAKNLDLGIVHDASRTGQTVYLEPRQVVPLGNQQRLAEAELESEIRRILAELSALVGRHSGELEPALAVAAELDGVCARADFARRLGAVRPEVGTEGVVRLLGVRHPVLILRGVDVVANDLRLDRGQPILVLTGPNAGGKTVALKAVGLCALMIRCGCFVPAADGSRVDLFTEILADIGDRQTVVDGLSSFSGHLKTLRSMLDRAGHGSLLLLDELASGTDPAQGGALARALLERFATLGARVVATTHYAQVKAMAAGDERVQLAAMEYRDERPTYRVVAGMAGESHALATAARLGIDAAVVERARALMDEGERALSDALAALEAERDRSERLARAAEETSRSLAQREATLASREEKIKLHAKQLEDEAAAAFLARVRAAEQRIAEVVARLQRAPTSREAEAARATVRAERSVLAARTQPHEAGGRVVEPAAVGPIEVGDRVRVVRLDLAGEVITVKPREVEVRAGNMSVRVRPDEVVLTARAGKSGEAGPHPPRSTSPTAGSARTSHSHGPMRVPGNTLDLRGARVEEGLRALERFLDEAMLRNHDAVFVLHGHGTGAMKEAVRDAMARSPYAVWSGPADAEQGGDALTVVVLRA